MKLSVISDKLSRASATVDTAGHEVPDQTQYLTFVLGGETFAIGILKIKEIIEYEGLTPVPMMPVCIRGVINLRGAVVPVLDLSSRLGRKISVITRRTCIIIVEVGSGGEALDMGLIVDAVNAVVEIPRTETQPPPAFGARLRTDFIEAMGNHDGRFVILLDTDQVLSPDDISSLVQTDEAQDEAITEVLDA
jgi:purine-binding chemotaxis protein CheW